MNVDEILEIKGRSVVNALAWQSVQEVIGMLADKNISSVIMLDARSIPIGIVTDRIIVDALANCGTQILTAPASDIMQTPIPHCRPQDSIQRAMQLMTDRRVRHLLVLDDGHALGLVSIGDLVKYRVRDAELENGVLRDLVPGWAASG